MRLHGLIEYLRGKHGDAIRYTANHDTVFPVHEIRFSVRENGQATVCLSYLGLWGVDSCLPIDFEHYLLGDSLYAKQLYALLTAINHAIYRLHHSIWCYGHPLMTYNESRHIQSKTPTLLHLSTLLKAQFPAITLSFTTFAQRWQSLNQACQIQKPPLELSNNAYLGKHVLNASRTIAIMICLPSDQDITAFLPQGKAGKRMAELLQHTIPELGYILQFTFSTEKLVAHSLGKQRLFLAWNSILINRCSVEHVVLHIDQCHYKLAQDLSPAVL